jgi:ankyrin repeat protein
MDIKTAQQPADLAKLTKLNFALLRLIEEKAEAEKTQAVIENGADVNAKNLAGDTLLIWAAGEGHADVCLALISKGADVYAKNLYGRTPLFRATGNGHAYVCGKGAEANAKNGTTPLNWAASYGHADVCKVLLRSMLLQELVSNEPQAFTERRLRLKTTLLVLRIRLMLPYDLIRIILCGNSELKADLLAVLYYDYYKDRDLPPTYWEILKSQLPNENLYAIKVAMAEAFAKCENDNLRSLLNPETFKHNFENLFLTKVPLEDKDYHE